MKEVSISSIGDLSRAVENIQRSDLCRGVSDSNYELKPSLFRCDTDKNYSDLEQSLMWIFKTHAKAHLDRIPKNNLEWLVIAQHHGLPTRLLDWSLSPLIACFFAVNSNPTKDGAIYIYSSANWTREEEIDIPSIARIYSFIPSHISKRITSQSGVFTIHPNHLMILKDSNILKVIIPAKKKSTILKMLVKFGIHYGTISPDLDGLSKYIKHVNNIPIY